MTMVLLLLIWMWSHGPVLFPLHQDRREMIWLRRFFADMLVKTYQTDRYETLASTQKLRQKETAQMVR